VAETVERMLMRKQALIVAVSALFCFVTFAFGSARIANAQAAGNANRDLAGVNHGDFIALQWDDAQGATQYYVYTSTTSLGPWALAFSVSDNLGGAKVHYTPDARLMTLCYKVEATDANGFVIRVYDPICVPQYSP